MEKSIERDHLKIAYLDEGAGNTTLLFVHGSFIDKSYWADQIEYFRKEYRVIAVDLPGHGHSGNNRTTWNIREYGQDICFLINELKLQNAVLIGHSMGGDIILEVAAQCLENVIGFVGVDNFKNAGTALPDEIQAQSTAILEMLKSDFANTSEYYARQALLSETTDGAITNRVVSDYRNMNQTIGYDLIADCFTYYARERELMEQIPLKMHLIPVDYLPFNEEPLKRYAASGYEIIPMKGTCHYPMIENPDELNFALRKIMANLCAVK
jgi:sigma-B regulation protein RsbQ